MRPTIVVAGLGETGSELVERLAQNWIVYGIELDAAAAALAARRFDEDPSDKVFIGDASSALVLRRARVEGAHAVVACTGSDEVNLEVLRLAGELFRIENRFALMYQMHWEEKYRGEGIDLVSQDLACAALLESRVERGLKVATSVGLGHGEVIEVEVLANSAVVGRPLAELRPIRWLVGAVYRNDELIVPHGDTVIEAGDRVLIIGDPVILPSIATLIRSGKSEFPMQYGTRVVSIQGRDAEGLVPEVAYIVHNTRATRFEAIACQADEDCLQGIAAACDEAAVPFRSSCAADRSVPSLVRMAERRDIGVLAMAAEPLTRMQRVGLGRSRSSRIIDLLSSPVLIARGSFPYRRVMLVLAELPFDSIAGQVAIDLVRILDAELHLGVVNQPDLVAGIELRKEMAERRHAVENMAGMYHVEVQTRVLEGNPIREVIAAAADYDLLVLPYAKGRRGFLTRPDVAMNILHGAPCSVMVMPH